MEKIILSWMRFQREAFVLFLFILVGIIGYGAYVAFNSEIMAFPEFTNVQLNIQTQWPGHAAEEIERLITIPLETATRSVPGVINSTSLSEFGLSVILLTISGVSDVEAFGGPTRTIEIKIDIPRMESLGLTIAQIAQNLGANHQNAGG